MANQSIFLARKMLEIDCHFNMVICPYCQIETEWVENKEIYGRNYGKSYMIYLCRTCGAYIGCHNNTKDPLGTPANAELRLLRRTCHERFDSLWLSGSMSRRDAYKLLSKIMNKELNDSHFGMFTEEECIQFLSSFNNL